MPRYVQEGEAIEGLKIYCQFKERPSININEERNQEEARITGSPAVARILQVYKYQKKR